MRSGLRAKILIAFLLLSLTPLCLSALFIFFSATRVETSVISFTMESLYILFGLAAVAAVLLAFSFSRRLTKPLNQVVRSVRTLAKGPSYERVEYRADDELGDLARSVNQLAYQLKLKQQKLDESFNALEKRLHLLEEIERISDLMGTTFNPGPFLQKILRTSVEGLGFDWAILYLLDQGHQLLQYQESYGFTSDQEALMKGAPYRMEVHDCVETRVIREKRPICVQSSESYGEATPLDISTRKTMGSRAFAYAPLMVQEDVIGILGVGRIKTEAPISETELHSLQILANHAARVVEMSRLYGEILEDRASLDGILQSMLAGILAVDSHGLIKSINLAAERMLGVDRDDIIGAPLKTAFSADGEAAEIVQGLLEWGERYGKFEMRFKTGDDERVFYLSSSKIHSQTREPVGLIIVLQDITQKKQFDEHVGRMERLASLGRLAAGVAHEIRNPLTGLTLLLDDLHDRWREEPAIQGQVQGALAAVARIEHLVTELLAHVSPQKEVIQPCDINQLIENTVALVSNQTKKARVSTELKLDAKLALYEGDPHRLSQAVLNVVLNAIQAMPEGGLLQIESTEIDADLLEHQRVGKTNAQARGSSIIIRIADSGTGIPREICQKVFEPFFTTKREGTGLGLYITYQIIADHGGDVFISENSGGGTVFSIFLPRNGHRLRLQKTGTGQV